MSTTPHWNSQANEIFLQAVQLTDADRRKAFLADACQGDLSMRVEVEELLLANEEAGDFLEEPLSRLPEALIPPEAEPPLTHVGPYRLLEPPIGEGGMGVVYKAVQEAPVRRQVALKVIKPGLDTRQVIRRFEAERQALALMDHPNIARVLEAGATSAGRPYFVMELVMGVPITTFCDQHQLCRRDRLALFIDVCQAVQHAHQKGIIHRDLKPSNLLVTAPEGRPIVKVIDFGIAKAISENPADHTGHTASAPFIGTPLYMSPEQATMSAVDVDTRSDVYSLGVLLYELVTGTTPVHQETLRKSPETEVRRIICEDDPPLPSQRAKTLTPAALRTLGEAEPVDARKLSRQLAGELDWIVMQALEKDRDRRYESASALAADVGRCLNDETVLACPPSKLYRLRKLARRNRGALTTGVLILAALLSGTALATWQAVEANRARNHADVLLEESQQARNQANQERYRAEESAEEARWYQYAGEVQLAMRAWQRNDVRQMNEFLARHFPATHENDLRGFEWHFLSRHSDLRSREISRSDSAYHIVRLSPDGTRIAVAGADGQIRLLSSQTFETEQTIDTGQTEVNGLDFASDGSMLASGGDNGAVVLWNARTGDEIRRFRAHDSAVYQVLFAQANQQLITCGRDPEIRLWNTSDASSQGELKHHTGDVESLSLSRLGLLAAGSSDETTSVWNVMQQQLAWQGSSDPPSKIKVVAFSPSGEWLATGHDLGLLTIRRSDLGGVLAHQE